MEVDLELRQGVVQRLSYGAIKALLRHCQGSIKARLRDLELLQVVAQISNLAVTLRNCHLQRLFR